MSDELETGAGPDEATRKQLAIPDDTEGHKKRVMSVTDEPDGGPDQATRKQLAIPDSDDDTEGHKR